MEKIYPYLYRSVHEFPFSGNFKTSAFLIIRPKGNLLVYGSSKINDHFNFIVKNGSISKQYISHRDEASRFCDVVTKTYKAPLYCPEDDKDEIAAKCTVAGTFSGDQVLEDDFEVIATPGHSPGSSCFYFKSPDKNILFVGDNLFPDSNGVWVTFLLDKNEETRRQTAASLGKLREIKVDTVVPAGTECDIFYKEVTQHEWQCMIDDAVKRLQY